MTRELTFKEQIFNRLWNIDYANNTISDVLKFDLAVADILLIIEKRIDSRIKNMENSDWWYKNLPKPRGVGTEIFDAQMQLLEEIKEMLK